MQVMINKLLFLTVTIFSSVCLKADGINWNAFASLRESASSKDAATSSQVSVQCGESEMEGGGSSENCQVQQAK